MRFKCIVKFIFINYNNTKNLTEINEEIRKLIYFLS